MATKLHQILAVEEDRKRTAYEILNESLNTFKNKGSHFEGMLRKYSKRNDDGVEYPTERKALITTVNDRLSYTVKHWKTYTDVVLQKEETNSSGAARAEVVIGDTSLGEFSATALLALEKNLIQFIEMLRHLPTLDPSIEWELDADNSNQYKSRHTETTVKTAKEQQPLVLYEVTEHHPAQVQMATYDVPVGYWTLTRNSGKITPGDKALILNRAEELLISVKKARTKANECGTVPVKSDRIFNYITKGKV